MKYRILKYRGYELYHGTSSSEDFESIGNGTPRGPAYFAIDREWAEFFAINFRSGKSPRVIKYRVFDNPILFDWSYEAVAEMFGFEDIDDLDFVDELEIEKMVCSHGFDGWIRESDGWEVMLCKPEKFLEWDGCDFISEDEETP